MHVCVPASAPSLPAPDFSAPDFSAPTVTSTATLASAAACSASRVLAAAHAHHVSVSGVLDGVASSGSVLERPTSATADSTLKQPAAQLTAPTAQLAAQPPLPAGLAQMFDEPIGLGAAPAVSSNSRMEQQLAGRLLF